MADQIKHAVDGCGKSARKRRRSPATKRTIMSRFLEKIEYDTNGGCWLWAGYVTPLGYGKMGICTDGEPRTWLVHRVAWMLFREGDPGALCVCHRCDVPACCNPNHLFLGTKADNTADMVAKGRAAFGAKSGSAKLTEEDVREILSLRGSGLSQREIGERFGVIQQNINLIMLGKRWAHITSPRPGTSHP